MASTSRSQVRRIPERGSRDPATVNRILDAGLLASVGFCTDGQPYVIPMLYGRSGQALYLHGSAASRLMLSLDAGISACAAITLVDGLVLARSSFHHSMNYRSVVAFGTARAIKDPRQKIEALRVISEHLISGRWKDVRGPNRTELNATLVLEFTVEEASAKVRHGPPTDEDSDYASPAWAGVLPLGMKAGPAIADHRLTANAAIPDYVRRYDQRLASGCPPISQLEPPDNLGQTDTGDEETSSGRNTDDGECQ